MRRVDIGILLSEEIVFSLNGTFSGGGSDYVTGESRVVASGDCVEWQGRRYDRLLFTPKEADCTFTVYNVVIGIDFHWERRENQLFAGARLFFVEDGKVRLVNCIGVEDYLQSVISSEMSSTSSLQLLKAHAVISRSWLYAQLARAEKECVESSLCEKCDDGEIVRWYAREDHKLFDFCADDHCQRYQGMTRAMNPNVVRAVAETSGVVLVSEGAVCDARFSKCCGGITENFSSCWENVDVPYLATFRDAPSGAEPFDASSEEAARRWIEGRDEAFCSAVDSRVLAQVLNGYDRETNDFYRWTVTYTTDELSALIKRKSGIDFGRILELVPLQRGASGRIIKLKIVGSEKTMIVGKELEIRRWLSPSHLYSSAFVVDKQIDAGGNVAFVLRGAGWGHGVGLCQIGAAAMSEQGYDYRAILSHYYPSTELKNINEL